MDLPPVPYGSSDVNKSLPIKNGENISDDGEEIRIHYQR